MQRILKAMTIALAAAALMFGQGVVVRRSTIFIDTVKRGDMTQTAHGLGTLTGKMTAELKIPEAQAKQITSGQAAFIDTRAGVMQGTVVGINPPGVDGSVTVKVHLEGDLPAGVRPGLEVDGTIRIEELKDVIYVRRPATSSPESAGTLFKLDPDKQHVTKVQVQYGRNFAHAVEVRSGLQAGDQVILSDMSAFNASNRLRLE
jgi:multidrug efflux pump subunit AcrA (membrane-fusion protein)